MWNYIVVDTSVLSWLATQTEALSAFEIEVIRLLKETNNILTENQVLMKENKAQFTEMNEKLRKLLLNTN